MGNSEHQDWLNDDDRRDFRPHYTKQESQDILMKALADKMLQQVQQNSILRREFLMRVGARAAVRVAASHCIMEVKVKKKKKLASKLMVAWSFVFKSV